MKAQSSIEFLTYVSFSMFMLAALYGVMAERQAETFQQRTQERAVSIADKIAFNLEMALVQGQGYSRVISLPQGIAGQRYDVFVTDNLIRINWSSGSVVEPTRYVGRNIRVSSRNSDIYRIKHNTSGVYMIAK